MKLHSQCKTAVNFWAFVYCATTSLCLGQQTDYSFDRNGNLASSSNQAATKPKLPARSIRVSAIIGKPLSLTVPVTGSGTIRYQWLYNGALVLGATNDSLFFASAAVANSGVYSLVASNSSGSVTSAPMSVIVAPTNLPIVAAAYGPNGFVAITSDPLQVSSTILFSSNGLNWTTCSATGFELFDVTTDGGRYAIVGRSGTQAAMITSSDGNFCVNANTAAIGTFARLNTIANGAGLYWAMGEGGRAQYSADCLVCNNWAGFEFPEFSDFSVVRYVNNHFFAAASSQLAYSINGANWFVATNWPVNAGLRSFAYGNGHYVGAGDAAFCMYSIDATNWVASKVDMNSPGEVSEVTGYIRSIIFANNAFFGVGSPGKLLISQDGVTWAVASSGIDEALSSTAFGNGLLLGFGYGGSIVPLPMPPWAKISLPSEGTAIVTNIPIILQAEAGSSSGSISKVEFFVDGLPVGAAVNAPFRITWTPTLDQNQEIYAIATDQSGLSSKAASVFLGDLQPPKILSGPKNDALTTNSSITLSVLASGTAPLSYLWYQDGRLISGANQSVLTVNSGPSLVRVVFSVVVTNRYGVAISDLATVRVVTSPYFLTQPTNLSVAISGSANFISDVVGVEPLRYQWWKAGTLLPGQTNAALILNDLLLNDAGTYTLQVSNFFGTATSSLATLTVLVPRLFTNVSLSPNGFFRMQFSSPIGQQVRLQYSSNLLTWLPLYTNTTGGLAIIFSDTNTPKARQRFYRTVSP